MIPLRLFAVGPNRETAANPMKNPRVAPANPWIGVPIVLKPECGSSFIRIFFPTIGPEASCDFSDPMRRTQCVKQEVSRGAIQRKEPAPSPVFPKYPASGSDGFCDESEASYTSVG